MIVQPLELEYMFSALLDRFPRNSRIVYSFYPLHLEFGLRTLQPGFALVAVIEQGSAGLVEQPVDQPVKP